jgi:hypothetical protein
VSRRRTAPVAASATWRDGVHLTATPIWCDARRRRDICFVSSADRIGRAGHGQLIATAPTLALVGARGDGNLSVPLRRRFTLGTLRLELLPSGRGLGAAALLVDNAGRTVLYAGAVRGDGPEPCEVRACDAVVVAAPFGEPHHAFPKVAAVADQVATWVASRAAAGERAVLVTDAILDALEVISELATRGVPVAATRAVREAAARVAITQLVAPRQAHALVCVEHDRTTEAERGPKPVHALLSGRVLDLAKAQGPKPKAPLFPWPFAAGHAELLRWIDATGAREVFVTGACADAIVAAVGPRARTLGPPQQMALFEAS